MAKWMIPVAVARAYLDSKFRQITQEPWFEPQFVHAAQSRYRENLTYSTAEQLAGVILTLENIRLVGPDTDFVQLIDALLSASGLAQVLGGQIAQHNGLVDVPATETADMARVLRYYAEVLERRHA